jgi:hypothetical protein
VFFTDATVPAEAGKNLCARQYPWIAAGIAVVLLVAGQS